MSRVRGSESLDPFVVKGGADANSGMSGSWPSWVYTAGLLLAIVMAAGALGWLMGIQIGYTNRWSKINHNDNRLDDLDDHFDHQDDDELHVTSRVDFEDDVVFEGDVEVEGRIAVNNFASCPNYPVCSGSSAVAGQAVSLNGNCVANGFDAFPSYVLRSGAASTNSHDRNSLLSIDGANSVLLKQDPDAADQLKLWGLRLDGNTYAQPVAAVNVGGVGSSSASWAMTGNGDGQTAFVVRTDATASDVTLYRCTSTDAALSCDSGVLVLAANSTTILDVHYAGSVLTNDLFVVLYVDESDQLSTIAFTATAVADAALVGVGGAVVIDTDATYAPNYLGDAQYHGHLVDLQGANGQYAFGIVYGGVATTPAIQLIVHTLGLSPIIATPTQTVVPGGAHVFTTPTIVSSDDVEFWAETLPGTNHIAVLVSDFQADEPASLYSVSLVLTATQDVVAYTTPSGQGTVVQYSPDYTYGSDADSYRLSCISATTCVVVYRGRGAFMDYGFVSVAEFSSTGAISALHDRAVFAGSEPRSFSVVPASSSQFVVVYSEQTVGGTGEQAKIALGTLSGSDLASAEIHFGLTSKGPAPLGIAAESCAAGTACSICIAGVYQVPTTSPLASLKYVTPIYAYPNGAIGISPLVPGSPLHISAPIATHIGAGNVVVRADGQLATR